MSYFKSHMDLTLRAIEEYKPQMVVWPETMAPYPFNKQYLRMAQNRLGEIGRDPADLEYPLGLVKTYRELCDAATKYNVHLVVGNMSVTVTGPDDYDQQNTAVFIAPLKGEIGRYAKVHLVPFGEYIPFTGKGTWLRSVLLNLTPLKRDYSLVPGKEWTIFTLPPKGGVGSAAIEGSTQTRFAVPICFEDIMPGPARAMVGVNETGSKRVDYLVSVSNDGWFFQAELDLHLQACQVRAIENRVPIARSVNTGNSGFVDSCGRVRALLAPQQIGTAGWQMELDARITLYSRIGDLLPILCGIGGVLMVAWTFVRPRKGKKA
jgi:apolipoprotein N-acyltransferase